MPNYLKNLKTRYRIILSTAGEVILGLSGLLFAFSILSFIFNESEFFVPFFVTFLFSFILGLIMKMFNRNNDFEYLNLQDAIMIIFIVWTTSITLSTIPFVYSGLLNVTQAFFESTSGWTTTGLSMFTDVEVLPKTILLWRSMMQYIGGAGFALIMVITAGSMGAGLYQAEGRTDNLVPNFKDSTKLIMQIYFFWTIAGIISLIIFTDMPLFDSVNHTMAALSTGGFSTKNLSILAYDSINVEIIVTFLMFAGSIGFGVHYAILLFFKNSYRNVIDYRNKRIDKLQIKDKIKREPIFKNPEPKLMVILIIIGIIFLLFNNIGFRKATFQIISAITTTGFGTTDISSWNSFGIIVMTFLMIIGGMMDSTSGGLKIFRVWLVLRILLTEIKNIFKPKGTKFYQEIYKGVSKKNVDINTLKNVIATITFYFIVYILGVLIYLKNGYPLDKSMFEYASTLSTVGLSVGLTAPDAPNNILWLQTIGMYLGRLEFFVILYAIMKLFKDIKDIIKWEH
ncbi:MAG: trk/ktr system potassium uptake protein [Geotoga sp.]|jgi:trk system potassium uptake protein TrkH|nr:trk/ktr system potassium uptake protein [Geotoga sp.]